MAELRDRLQGFQAKDSRTGADRSLAGLFDRAITIAACTRSLYIRARDVISVTS